MENQQKKIIYILGGPGSGKGTHCERLVRDFSFNHISVGDLMRAEINSKSQLGNSIEKYVKNGEIVPTLVPTHITIQLLMETIKKANSKKYLIDGFPCGIEQALELERTFIEIKFILNFNCSEEILVQRILNRGLTSGRNDDNEETIRKRITTFNEKTVQAVKLCQKFGKVTNILSEGSIEDVYKQVLPAIFPNVIFFYGAPVLGKSTVAKKLAERMNYFYLDLHQFFEDSQCQDNYEKVNKLMEYLMDHYERNFIIDDFFATIQQLEVYFQHFIKPNKIFYFSTTKDNVDNNIFMYKKTVKEQEQEMKNYQKFSIARKEILPALRKSEVLIELDACQSLEKLEQQILGNLKPMIIFTQNSSESQFYSSLCEQLEQQEQFIELSMPFIIQKEIERGTILGKLLLKYPDSKQIPIDLQCQLLNKIIFNNPKNKRFLISGFPNKDWETYKEFENQCCRIDYVMGFSDAMKDELQQKLMLESYYNLTGRYFLIQDADIRFVQQYLVKRKQYAMVLGAAAMGKTLVSKALENQFGFVIPDYEKISTQLKEVLGGEDGPLEELTFEQLATQLKKNVQSQPMNQLTLFDGFPYEDKELQQFIEMMGDPTFIIILKGTKEAVVSGFKRKNEMEPDAEINEDDTEKIDLTFKQQQKIVQYFEGVKEKSLNVRVYEIDATQKIQKIVQDALSQFSKKIVVCNFNLSGLKLDYCWRFYAQVLNNICTKKQIRFVDVKLLINFKQIISQYRQLIQNEFNFKGPFYQELDLQFKMRWSETPLNFPGNYSPQLIISLIKQYLEMFQQPQKRVLLFGFPSGDNFQERKSEEQFFPRILDELNAIQTQLGQVNSAFMITDNFESQEYDDPVQAVLKIQQEQPVAKQQDGQDDEEKDKKDDEDDPEKKKKFNPDEYQWTISDGNPKNFAQILAKNTFQEEQIILNEENLLQTMELKVNELFADAEQKKFIQFLNYKTE